MPIGRFALSHGVVDELQVIDPQRPRNAEEIYHRWLARGEKTGRGNC